MMELYDFQAVAVDQLRAGVSFNKARRVLAPHGEAVDLLGLIALRDRVCRDGDIFEDEVDA
jgi:hypothetical protein